MASKDAVIPNDLKVGFIGGGKMGFALSTGFVRSGTRSKML